MPHSALVNTEEVPRIAFRPPDQEKTVPEYATIDELKERLGIDSGDFDDRLTVALVAAEIKIEEHLGRAFPDVGLVWVIGTWLAFDVGEPGDGEMISDIPERVLVSKIDYFGNDFRGLEPLHSRDISLITVEPGGFEFSVNAVNDFSDRWGFVGTTESGTFPPDGTLGYLVIRGLEIPDPSPVISEIPETVHQKAINLGMLEYKKGDSPLGLAGSDAFIGELNVADAIRAELNDRTLLGLKVSWGVA